MSRKVSIRRSQVLYPRPLDKGGAGLANGTVEDAQTWGGIWEEMGKCTVVGSKYLRIRAGDEDIACTGIIRGADRGSHARYGGVWRA